LVGRDKIASDKTEYLLIFLIADCPAGAPASRPSPPPSLHMNPPSADSRNVICQGFAGTSRHEGETVRPFSAKASDADWFLRGWNASRRECSIDDINFKNLSVYKCCS